jgi:hypothetical protein
MRFIPIAAAALVAAAPAAAQTAFEGVVKYRMTTEGRTMDVTYMTKGDKARSEMQMDGMPVAMLLDASKSTMSMIMTSERMYMTMDLSRMGQQAQGDSLPKVTATGRKETIAGHECEHYLMGDAQNIDMCVATGIGYFMAGGGGGGARGPGGPGGSGGSFGLPRPGDPRMAEFRRRFKDGFFPLRLTVTEGGQMKTDMVVTSVERRALADDLFTVPAGYTEMRMPGMPGMPRP